MECWPNGSHTKTGGDRKPQGLWCDESELSLLILLKAWAALQRQKRAPDRLSQRYRSVKFHCTRPSSFLGGAALARSLSTRSKASIDSRTLRGIG